MSSLPDPQASLLFKEAFERLENTVKSINSQDAPAFTNATLQQVYQACRQIEEELRKRKCVKNMARLKPFLQSLHHYHQAVEVLCNGTPYLSWIWGPMKLLLQITSEYPNAIEKLVAAYHKLSQSMPRYDKLSEAFRDDPDFQRRMALIYTDIIAFHREAYCLFSKKNWRFFFATLWGNFDRHFQAILDSLTENCRLLEVEAATTNILEIRNLRRNMEEEREQREKDRAISQLQGALKWLDVEDCEQEDELDKQHGFLHDHSCDWIQKQDPAKSWMTLRTNQTTLWITGKPGAGKSVLSAAMIRFLQQDQQSTILYFFCAGYSSSEISSAYVLRTMVAELIRAHPDMSTFVFNEHVLTGHSTSLSRVKGLLKNLLKTITFARVILDGVDELEPAGRDRVLDDVLQLATATDPRAICKVTIASRNLPAISARMSRYPVLDLDKQRRYVDVSIASYVRHELRAVSVRLTHTGDGAQGTLKEVEDELIEKAEGMFLWVRLVLHSLENVYGIEELHSLVHELPKGLDCLYARILKQIFEDSGEQKQSFVFIILSWMMHAMRPLKVFELAAAVRLRHSLLGDDFYISSWAWVLDCCKPLLEETKSGTVNFIHFTAREYFIRGTGKVTIEPRKASLEVSSVCLLSLVQGLEVLDTGKPIENHILAATGGSTGLSKYSVHYWSTHLLYSLSNTCNEKDMANLINLMDLLHERLQESEDPVGPEGRRNHKKVEPCDSGELPSVLLSYPHLCELLELWAAFENSRKQRAFKDCKDADAYNLDNDPTTLSAMLRLHRALVTKMMLSQSTPGTVRQVEKFRQHYARFAFSCSFWGCGECFRSSKDLADHEMLHAGGIKCPETSCSFHRIGFTSSKALRQHVLRFHIPQRTRPIVFQVRKKYICSGVIENVRYGCNRRFALEEELQAHRLARQGTACDGSVNQTPHLDGHAQKRPQSAKGFLQRNLALVAATDTAVFPRNILSFQDGELIDLSIKTWGQLKEYASQNPRACTNLDVPKIKGLQSMHYEDDVRPLDQATTSSSHARIQDQQKSIDRGQQLQSFNFDVIDDQHNEPFRAQDQGQQVVPASGSLDSPVELNTYTPNRTEQNSEGISKGSAEMAGFDTVHRAKEFLQPDSSPEFRFPQFGNYSPPSDHPEWFGIFEGVSKQPTIASNLVDARGVRTDDHQRSEDQNSSTVLRNAEGDYRGAKRFRMSTNSDVGVRTPQSSSSPSPSLTPSIPVKSRKQHKPRVKSEKRIQDMTTWWAERKDRQKKVEEERLRIEAEPPSIRVSEPGVERKELQEAATYRDRAEHRSEGSRGKGERELASLLENHQIQLANDE